MITTNIKLLQTLVRPEQFTQIGVWNKERNNLDFDASTEVAMLAEEFKEYFDATELVDKLDAVCDILFVGSGTVLKGAANYRTLPDFTEHLEAVVSDFAGQCGLVGIEITLVGALIGEGLAEVIAANTSKGTNKDENGKVIKPEGFVGPEAKLQGLIDVAIETAAKASAAQVSDVFPGGQ